MAAYAHYQVNEYVEAIGALDQFIDLNPSNPNVDYAYYKGLSYYEQIVDVGRDQNLTEALQTFDELVDAFRNPSTPGTPAQARPDPEPPGRQGDGHGRWYMQRGQYLALNRFRTVVDQFDTTDQVPEALRMTRLTPHWG